MIKIIHNAETGEKFEVELSLDEIQEIQERANLAAQDKKAKKDLLDRLGITEEEAKLLLS